MDHNQTLVRLMYASVKDKYVTGNELQELLGKAQKHNSEHDITGALIFNSQYFLQVLEGPRTEVNNLYYKILSDTRHHEPQIIKMNQIENRKWQDWSMEFISITEEEEALCERYIDQKTFNPYQIKAQIAEQFLIDVSNQQGG